jgi:hypothetical protein
MDSRPSAAPSFPVAPLIPDLSYYTREMRLSILIPVYNEHTVVERGLRDDTSACRPNMRRVSQQDTQNQTVNITNITRSGKKYHLDGCRHLTASKTATILKDVMAKGYTACKVCHPPE